MKTNVFAVWMYIISIIITCYSDSRTNRCVPEVTRDPGFQECAGNYSAYREWVMSPSVSMETNVSLTLICSPETRWFMECLLSFIQHCPALLKHTYLSQYHELNHPEMFQDLDQFCHSSLGTCYSVHRCIASIEFPRPSTFIPSPTPFSLMQDGVRTLCGPIKKTIDCLNGTGDQCRSHLNDNRKMLNSTQPTFLTMSTSHPAYVVTKHFVINDCATIPADFSTNKCVQSSVMSDGFVQCYEEVIAKYPQQSGSKRCDAYKAGHRCVANFIGNKCGQEYTEVFVAVSPLLLFDVPVCPDVEPLPVSSDDTGNSKPEPEDETVTGIPGILPSTGLYPSSSSAKVKRTFYHYAICFCFVTYITYCT